MVLNEVCVCVTDNILKTTVTMFVKEAMVDLCLKCSKAMVLMLTYVCMVLRLQATSLFSYLTDL